MRKRTTKNIPAGQLLAAALLLIFLGVMWEFIPGIWIRILIFACGLFSLFLVIWWGRRIEKDEIDFAGRLCGDIDALMDGCGIRDYCPYEETRISRVQGKLLQYDDKMRESCGRSDGDKQIIQELLSHISHQVKTPVSNLRMFTDILQTRELSFEKREQFLATMASQVDKLDFLMQSLIKMSRLETGTFTMRMEQQSLYDTIAKAVSGIWPKAERKKIAMSVECDSQIVAEHDPRWTAEALENILDNGVKYTPRGGSIRIRVRPWQFYIRIDISDTGMGIEREHYHDVFRRFYRGKEAASQEGVGLGLYLARGIITAQKGYISVKSAEGEGSTFSVFLPGQAEPCAPKGSISCGI